MPYDVTDDDAPRPRARRLSRLNLAPPWAWVMLTVAFVALALAGMTTYMMLAVHADTAATIHDDRLHAQRTACIQARCLLEVADTSSGQSHRCVCGTVIVPSPQPQAAPPQPGAEAL